MKKKKQTPSLPSIPSLAKPAKPWDLLNPKIGRVTDEVKAERLSACEGCEFFLGISRNCLKCGCFMDLKAGLPHAACPVGKWHAVADTNK
jgi:hypothetical protein